MKSVCKLIGINLLDLNFYTLKLYRLTIFENQINYESYKDKDASDEMKPRCDEISSD